MQKHHKLRIMKKPEINKKSLKKYGTMSLIFIIIVVCIAAIYFLRLNTSKEKKIEKSISNALVAFNGKDWEEFQESFDIKSYYIMSQVLKEEEFTKFDTAYKNLDEKDEDYVSGLEALEECFEVDDEILDALSLDAKVTINNIEACSLIQNTKNLYKLRINFNYLVDGNSTDQTEVLYVANVDGEYKIVYGEFMDFFLNFYQTAWYYSSFYSTDETTEEEYHSDGSEFVTDGGNGISTNQ